MTFAPFDVSDIFYVVDPVAIVACASAGFVIGFVFTARLSAHVSWTMMLLRLLITGGAFINTFMVVRWVEGAERWEAWLGIGVAYIIYALTMSLGIREYDRRFRRQMEKALGRPLRGNPRVGILMPSETDITNLHRRREDKE